MARWARARTSVAEFYQFRHRLLRFLAERHGFTVYGLESGFSEGLAIGAWIQGGAGDVRMHADESITYRVGQSAPTASRRVGTGAVRAD